MKTNRKTRDKDKGVTSALGTILIMPVIMMLIAAMILWSQSVFAEIDGSNKTLEDLEHEIKDNPVDMDVSLSKGNIVWMDDFEGEQQWYTFSDGASDFDFSHDEHFYTLGHSLQTSIDYNPDHEVNAGIYKPFPNQNYGRVCIEIAFTIDQNELYKNFSVFTYDNNNNYENAGFLLLDIKNNELKCYDEDTHGFVTFADDITFKADKYCWHTMRLIVDFEPNDHSKKSHYVSFTLDDEYYSISKYTLKNPTNNGISSNAVYVSYSSSANKHTTTTSYVDDFIFRNLDIK